MSAILALPDLRTGHKTKPGTRKDAPADSMGFGKQVSVSSKNTDKATLYFINEARAMPAFTSKTPEEREFVVESGASISMHILSKKVLSLDEMEIQEPHNGGNGLSRSANKRRSTSIRSRS